MSVQRVPDDTHDAKLFFGVMAPADQCFVVGAAEPSTQPPSLPPQAGQRFERRQATGAPPQIVTCASDSCVCRAQRAKTARATAHFATSAVKAEDIAEAAEPLEHLSQPQKRSYKPFFMSFLSSCLTAQKSWVRYPMSMQPASSCAYKQNQGQNASRDRTGFRTRNSRFSENSWWSCCNVGSFNRLMDRQTSCLRCCSCPSRQILCNAHVRGLFRRLNQVAKRDTVLSLYSGAGYSGSLCEPVQNSGHASSPWEIASLIRSRAILFVYLPVGQARHLGPPKRV